MDKIHTPQLQWADHDKSILWRWSNKNICFFFDFTKRTSMPCHWYHRHHHQHYCWF